MVDELVPSIATVVENVLVGVEDPVRQPVVAQDLPDIFHRVQFRRARRQEQKRDGVRDLELGRDVPAGLVEKQYGMGGRDRRLG